MANAKPKSKAKTKSSTKTKAPKAKSRKKSAKLTDKTTPLYQDENGEKTLTENQNVNSERERSIAIEAEPSSEIALHEPSQEGESAFRSKDAKEKNLEKLEIMDEIETEVRAKSAKLASSPKKVKAKESPRKSPKPTAADEGESALSAKDAIVAAREAIASAKHSIHSAKDLLKTATATLSAHDLTQDKEQKSVWRELVDTVKSLRSSSSDQKQHSRAIPN